MNSIVSAVYFLPAILLALTIHEFSHGFVAYKLGDPTAKLAGRLTLNPIPHIDPVGFILLLIVHIGWAKPVPVNPMNLNNPERDVVFVALAGPVSNLLSAIVVGMLLRLLIPFDHIAIVHILNILSFDFVLISVVLCFFNLIPLPPLDGWRVASYFIKDRSTELYIERIGPFLLLFVLVLPMFGLDLISLYLRPFINISLKLIVGHAYLF